MTRIPVVQLDCYGCGVACVAFVLGVSYKEARKLFVAERISNARTYCFDISSALSKKGLIYKYVKVHLGNDHLLDKNGVIAFVRKNNDIYPMGHYLVRLDKLWMDPWLNRDTTDEISKAMAGFRCDLRDEVAWVIYPVIN